MYLYALQYSIILTLCTLQYISSENLFFWAEYVTGPIMDFPYRK